MLLQHRPFVDADNVDTSVKEYVDKYHTSTVPDKSLLRTAGQSSKAKQKAHRAQQRSKAAVGGVSPSHPPAGERKLDSECT